jgi:glycyl-tRNA synthetase beta chain
VVADAIAEHYAPRFAGDALPRTKEACCVALADKLDTLVGIFGIGQIPTGDKDPFALRRHALGVIRILAERALPLDIATVLKLAHEVFPADSTIAKGASLESELAFITERARGYLREQSYTPQEVEAVLGLMPPPREFVPRLAAARAFLALPQAAGLAEADKRIRNILAKSDAVVTVTVDSAKFEENEEKQLLASTRALGTEVDSAFLKGEFSQALQLTAQLHQPVSAFFDAVMVNADDMAVRANRFALLREVAALTNRVVNLSKLAA